MIWSCPMDTCGWEKRSVAETIDGLDDCRWHDHFCCSLVSHVAGGQCCRPRMTRKLNCWATKSPLHSLYKLDIYRRDHFSVDYTCCCLNSLRSSRLHLHDSLEVDAGLDLLFNLFKYNGFPTIEMSAMIILL